MYIIFVYSVLQQIFIFRDCDCVLEWGYVVNTVLECSDLFTHSKMSFTYDLHVQSSILDKPVYNNVNRESQAKILQIVYFIGLKYYGGL